jgi:hypothetical protein
MLPPSVLSINPDQGYTGSILSITDLEGTGFQDGATVSISLEGEPPLQASDVVWISENRLKCSVDLTAAQEGLYSITVMNPDEQAGSLIGGLSITKSPVDIAEISPDIGTMGSTVRTQIQGKSFKNGARVHLKESSPEVGKPPREIDATNIQVLEDGTQISADVPIPPDTNNGYYDVEVENYDSASDLMEESFVIGWLIDRIIPNHGFQGSTVDTSIIGSHFDPDARVWLRHGLGHNAQRIEGQVTGRSGQTVLYCTFNLPETAETGPWTVVVENPHPSNPLYHWGFLYHGFTIEPSPEISISIVNNLQDWDLTDELENPDTSSISLSVQTTAPAWDVSVRDSLAGKPEETTPGHMVEYLGNGWGSKQLGSALQMRLVGSPGDYVSLSGTDQNLFAGSGSQTNYIEIWQDLVQGDTSLPEGSTYRIEVVFTATTNI